uniref:Putative 5.3 kDa protein n=1 Tax=Ixodes ricinus TaxID=34613 RepID=A0A0K8RKL1_IXORI
MRPLTIFIVTLLLLGSFHYVEPAPAWQVKSGRPDCEKDCTKPEECKDPCTQCNNGWWGDNYCKIKK